MCIVLQPHDWLIIAWIRRGIDVPNKLASECISPSLGSLLSCQNQAEQQKKLKKEENYAETKKKKKLTKENEPKDSQAEDQDSGVEVYFREKDRTKDKAKKKVSFKSATTPWNYFI